MTSLKEQKEAFVTGHEGTSPWEVLLVISTTPIGLLFHQAIVSTTRVKQQARRDWQLISLEAISFGVPMILCQSNLIYPWGMCYVSAQLMVGIIVGKRRRSDHDPVGKKQSTASDQVALHGLRATLTIYRASLMFLTFIAIFAVDFHVFPRRFVKTETQGYSLMDVGAASFVFAAGLVSARSRGRHQNWNKTMCRMIPLLILGLIRLLTHKGLDYQEHVSEYGAHWNFFFTLAMLSPTACLFPGPSLALPVALLSVYQAALSFGLQEWVVEAPRTYLDEGRLCNLFAANREGILGCVGYGALYLASEWIGHNFLWRPRQAKNYALLLVCLATSWLLLTTLLNVPVSRRTTNASFIMWVLFINVLQLLTIKLAAESDRGVPILFGALNANGLAMFVVANLLTGLTNLSINTLEVSDSWALIILFVYIHAVGGIAYGLNSVSQAITERGSTNEK